MTEIRELANEIFWNCIVITSSELKWRNQIEREAKKLTKAGLLPPHGLILAIDDPQPVDEDSSRTSGCGVGSGGATLNALLVVAERLSALAGYTTINSDVLSKNLILMVHFGRNSFHYPGGNAFLPVDSQTSWVPTSLQSSILPTVLLNSIWMASALASNSSNGVWITSLDFFVSFPSGYFDIPKTDSIQGALVCSIRRRSLVGGQNGPHGVLHTDERGVVRQATYKQSSDENSDENVICGTVFLSANLAENILSLYTMPPLDRCTYYGTDSACDPVQISLYFDLLLPLFSEVDRDQYLSGDLGHRYAEEARFTTLKDKEGVRARFNIWETLNRFGATECTLLDSPCIYLNPALPFSSLQLLFKEFKKNYKLFPIPKGVNDNRVVHINSVYDKSSEDIDSVILMNSQLGVTIGYSVDCILVDFCLDCDIVLYLGNRIIWQQWSIVNNSSCNSVITCHGFDDLMLVSRLSEEFTIFNLSWHEFSKRMQIVPEDIWCTSQQNVINAAIFCPELSVEDQLSILMSIVCPERTDDILNFGTSFSSLIKRWKTSKRISLLDVMTQMDVEKLTSQRDNVMVNVVQRLIRNDLVLQDGPFYIPFFKYIAAASRDYCLEIFDVLHNQLQISSNNSSQIFANIADLLGCVGGPEGGLRSGPAGNKVWNSALAALTKGDLSGFVAIKDVCGELIRNGRPEDIIRAARHYERASHILIGLKVETARKEVFPLTLSDGPPSPIQKDVWVEATCPARLDLAGGWSDTPPICYELGGGVLNVAIKVNGRRPIGARGRIIDGSPAIVYVSRDLSGTELVLEWKMNSDLADFANPVSPGALVKACLVYSEFVSVQEGSPSLVDQLKKRFNGRVELEVWSELAQGSGLGGSSILAGAILAVLFVLMGFEPLSPRKLIHATLGVEQMLTTGGGWQDQVGGLVGGVKLGYSLPKTPLVVETLTVPMTEEFRTFLNQRLFLIYTGKVRLARNLLQTVLRSWYSNEKRVVHRFGDLRSLALTAAGAVLSSDGSLLGDCIDQYWTLKKGVARGCEPDKVRKIMDCNSSKVLGQALAGAGGGGYLFGLAKDPCSHLQKEFVGNFDEMASSDVEIDLEGLKVEVDGKEVMVAGVHGDGKLTEQLLQKLKCDA